MQSTTRIRTRSSSSRLVTCLACSRSSMPFCHPPLVHAPANPGMGMPLRITVLMRTQNRCRTQTLLAAKASTLDLQSSTDNAYTRQRKLQTTFGSKRTERIINKRDASRVRNLLQRPAPRLGLWGCLNSGSFKWGQKLGAGNVAPQVTSDNVNDGQLIKASISAHAPELATKPTAAVRA